MSASAQSFLSGKIVEKETSLPVSNVTVSLSSNQVTVTNDNGEFRFSGLRPGVYTATISGIGYRLAAVELNTATGNAGVISLEKLHLMLQPIEIKAVRAGERAPFAKSNINKKQLEELNTGRDLPFVLNELPSVVVNSDAGNGVGYTAYAHTRNRCYTHQCNIEWHSV